MAFNKTVPNTIIKTKGVIYSAPSTPFLASFNPNKDAIPAATIPRGPTQLIKTFSLSFNEEPLVLKKTPIGRITKTTTAKSIAVFQLYISNKSSILMLAANKMNKIEISNTLKDSLK